MKKTEPINPPMTLPFPVGRPRYGYMQRRMSLWYGLYRGMRFMLGELCNTDRVKKRNYDGEVERPM